MIAGICIYDCKPIQVGLGGSSLKKLVLGNLLYEEEQEIQGLIPEVTNAFITNKTITYLDMSYCYLPDPTVAELIGKNTSIKTLFLACYRTDKVLESIKDNTTLETLYVRESQITDQAAVYIAQNTSLKKLRIDQSKITDIGARMLCTHPTLKKLEIHDSDITAQGTEVFLTSKLEEFSISTNLKQRIISRDQCYDINQAFCDSRNSQVDSEERPAKKLKMIYEGGEQHQQEEAQFYNYPAVELVGNITQNYYDEEQEY